MKIRSKKTIKASCDKLCGQLCRLHGECEHCGATEQLQWCHIHTRSIGKLRYEPKNYVCLCASCHRHFHNKPLQFTQFIGQVKGQDIVDWLIRESNKLEPLSINWYLSMEASLKEELDKLK